MGRKNLTTFKCEQLLLVEGQDEFGFLVRLLEFLKIETVQLHMLNGIDNLAGVLRLLPKTPGFDKVKRIGLLLDSDSDPAARIQSIRASLSHAGLASPAMPLTFSGTPSVVYTTVPSHELPGCLEDLIMQSAVGTGIANCVDTFLSCSAVQRTDIGSRYSKSWVHSLLSASEKPGLKIGEATTAKLINVEHEAFEPIRVFLALLTT